MAQKPNKITIVGGFGFIGQNLCEFFSEKGFTINIVGLNRNKKNFAYPGVEQFQLDISETQALLEIADGGSVIWLATNLIPGYSNESLVDDFQENIRPLIVFLESAKAKNIQMDKFIYFSSGGTVYGDVDVIHPIEESHPKDPKSSYGLSKLISEEYIKFLTHQSSFQSVILRPSNIYGRYQNLKKPQGIIGFALKAAKNQGSITLYDEGKVVRDFIHVTDVASAILSIIAVNKTAGITDIFNLGTGTPYSIADVVGIAQKVTGYNFPITMEKSRNFDCIYNVLDFGELNHRFGWKPEIGIEEGILDVWKWIKEEN